MQSIENQISNGCDILNNAAIDFNNYSNISIVGISLGGLVARGIIQKCDLKFSVYFLNR